VSMEIKTKTQSLKLTLAESLFLGFCAVFIVLMRAVLRLHLNIPGHAMLFTLFFLMLARGCVPYRFSATFTGLISALIAMLLALGKGGPLILIKFIPPALVIDFFAMVFPSWYNKYALCLVMAFTASSTKFLDTYIVDYLMGMDPTVNLQHALLSSLSGSLFGMAGSLLVPPVMKKLYAHGILRHHFGKSTGPASNGESSI
jgi:hypothetical protein